MLFPLRTSEEADVKEKGDKQNTALMKANLLMDMSCGSVVAGKHGLYVGGPGSIPTAVTTMTAAGGDTEHVSLNH